MDLLVSTDWLAARLGQPGLVVLDASAHLPSAGRDAAAEFAAGHIPGARFLGLGSLTDQTSPVPAALPRADQFAERMRALGVNTGTPGPDAAVLMRRHRWPALQLHQDGSRYFDVHHTDNDTLERIDPAALRQNAAAWDQ